MAAREREVAGNPTATVVRVYVIRAWDSFSFTHVQLLGAEMQRLGFWVACVLAALNGAVQAHEDSVMVSGSNLDPAAAIAVGRFDQTNFDSASASGAFLFLVGAANQKPIPAELMSELRLLRTRLSELWRPPAGATDPQELTVEINIKLKRDGTLAGPPTVLSRGDSPLFKAARDGAVTAIYQGQPFTMLRPERYDDWKEITVKFDPRYVPRR